MGSLKGCLFGSLVELLELHLAIENRCLQEPFVCLLAKCAAASLRDAQHRTDLIAVQQALLNLVRRNVQLKLDLADVFLNLDAICVSPSTSASGATTNYANISDIAHFGRSLDAHALVGEHICKMLLHLLLFFWSQVSASSGKVERISLQSELWEKLLNAGFNDFISLFMRPQISSGRTTIFIIVHSRRELKTSIAANGALLRVLLIVPMAHQASIVWSIS
jgi:hypothetical protein